MIPAELIDAMIARVHPAVSARGANDSRLDSGWQPSAGWARRYTTLRLAAGGAQVLGQPIADWSAGASRFFAEEFSRAHNPF
jgi:hypothetical protein